MSEYRYPIKRIGIIGGGQLGRMMIYRGKKLGFHFTILDPDPHAPASVLADEHIVGSLYDRASLVRLVEHCDVVTYEIEHTDTEVLSSLADEGYTILPHPKLLEKIQDKLVQKTVLHAAHVPVPDFRAADASTVEELLKMRLPFVQKARKGGYDGRGVHVVETVEDFERMMKTDFYCEEFVDFEKELAVMVARSRTGETASYPVVEMSFDRAANICDKVVAPAGVGEEIATLAQSVAVGAVESLGGVGIFGVELFLTKDRRILVNEIAPRPHNSGHYTMEACVTCQFEQHLRAISGLPLGSTDLLSPAVMINLLGEPGWRGNSVLRGFDEALAVPGASIHLYGKSETRPFRKMGHITVIGTSVQIASEKAQRIRERLRATGEERIE